jgi:hypothetical protein
MAAKCTPRESTQGAARFSRSIGLALGVGGTLAVQETTSDHPRTPSAGEAKALIELLREDEET